MGASYKYQNIHEKISFTDTTSKNYSGNYLKRESIPGVFAENSLSFLDSKASLMTGLRFDYHNSYDLIVTPRALIRYQPSDLFVIRASAGTGFRTINLLSEYSNILASSRNILITEELKPEKIFNYGVDIIYYFGIGEIGGSLNVDYYRTNFSNKIIPDYDSDPAKVIFSNLNGGAFSNILQAEANVNFFKNFDLKLAYKFIDLRYQKNGITYEQPFNAKDRILAAVTYSPKNDFWSFNAGLQWFGKQRLPSTSSNPVEYRRPNESEPFTMLNSQFNINFKYFEIYSGVENILDFKQENPIISADDPFGQYFDTSFIWGPTKGREFYLGFRFLLN